MSGTGIKATRLRGVATALLLVLLTSTSWIGAQAQYNGTAINSPTYTAGKFGNALTTNAASHQGVSVPAALFAFTAANDFTIDFWFKYPAVTAGNQVLISSAPSTYANYNFYIQINSSGQFSLVTGGNSITAASNPTTGAYHHVAWTHVGSSNLNTLYIDGASAGTLTQAYPAYGSQVPGVATYFGGSNSYDYTGQIDELRVSNNIRWTTGFTPSASAYTGDASTRALYHFDADANDTAGVTALAANGNILLQSVTNSAITLRVPYTGGTSPYTFVWQRALVTGSTIGTYTTLSNGSGISGATTATLVDASSLTTGARYAYKASVTDSTSAFINTFSRIVQLGQPAIKLVSFGDSTTVGWGGGAGDLTTSSIAYAAQYLTDFNGLRNVSYVAAGVPGTYTSDWTSTATGSNYANALAAAGGSFSGYYVFVRLGVNNAQAGRTAANFLSEMTTIVNNVVANGGIVLLDYPMWREPGLFAENGTSPFDETTTPLLLSYLPQIDSLVNNTTVFAGDKLSFDMTMSNPQLYFNYSARPYTSYPGGIHPSNVGTQVMGYHEGNALLKILNLLGTITSLSGRRFIH